MNNVWARFFHLSNFHLTKKINILNKLMKEEFYFYTYTSSHAAALYRAAFFDFAITI